MTRPLHIDTSTHALPLQRPFVTARGTYTTREVILVRVSDGEHVGFGEASPLPGFSNESNEQATRDVNALASAFRGHMAPGELEDVVALLASEEVARCCASARFALEVALLDLIAKRKGLSLATLLASGDGASTSVPVNATITAPEPARCFALAMNAFDRGFACFKVKVGGRSIEDDVARVKAVREAIGGATLRIDANGSWSREQALAALRAMEGFELALVEQPVAAEDLEGLALVRASSHVRVAADESIRSRESLERLLGMDAVDAIVLKPMMIGGLLPTLELQRHALERGVTTILTTSLEGAVGRAATLHLAAVCDSLEGPCGLDTGSFLASDLTSSPARAIGGAMQLDTTPGHGVVPDVRPLTRAVKEGPARANQALQIPHPLLQQARYFPEKIALVTEGGERWTYATLAAKARAIAAMLYDERGVRARDRVGVLAHNAPLLAALIHGVTLLGATCVLLHPGSGEEKLDAMIQRARLSALVADSALAPRVSEHAPIELEALSDLQRAQDRAFDGARVSLDMCHSVVMTSGTTGPPKMVALSWQNIVFSVTGSAARLGHLPSDRWLAALPLCHVAGLSILMRCLILGTTVVLHEAFDAKRCAEAIITGDATMVSVVSKMLWEILAAMEHRVPSPAFRLALVGGGPIPDDLLAASGEAGLPVSPTYGMSEGTSQLTTAAPGAVHHGAGAPLIWTELAIQSAPGDQVGEILVRGPTVTPGYLSFDQNDRAFYEPAADRGGWFATGDFGALDEDCVLQIGDRRVDRIVSGGENVSPLEIERFLRTHPSVRDACVVGIPDRAWGHRVEAVVTLDEPMESGESALLHFCNSSLAPFEVPKRIHTWRAIPRAALMKVDRARVRAILSGEEDAPTS